MVDFEFGKDWPDSAGTSRDMLLLARSTWLLGLVLTVGATQQGCDGPCERVADPPWLWATVPPGIGTLTWQAGSESHPGALVGLAAETGCRATFTPMLPSHVGTYQPTDDSLVVVSCYYRTGNDSFTELRLGFSAGDQNGYEVGSATVGSDVALFYRTDCTFGQSCPTCTAVVPSATIRLTVEQATGSESAPPEAVGSDYHRVFVVDLTVAPTPTAGGDDAPPVCPDLGFSLSVRFRVSADAFHAEPATEHEECGSS